MLRLLSLVLLILTLSGCADIGNDTISVLTREDGSGTRGAFIEIFGIEQENDKGKKTDKTVTSAETTNSTSVMITTVNGNKAAIGYVSLGSLDQTKVKALAIDGINISNQSIKDKNYKVVRHFNAATKGEPSPIVSDFLKFVLSDEGQKTVEKAGYISEKNIGKYTSSHLSGKISIGGSSSVTPVVEKLKEEYQKLNPNVKIDLQQNDSTSGISGTIDGIYDIGLASRDIKESEKAKGIIPLKIATDGIAIIVNKENPVNNLTSKQIYKIYTGEIALWSEIN